MQTVKHRSSRGRNTRLPGLAKTAAFPSMGAIGASVGRIAQKPLNWLFTHDQQAMNGARWGLLKDRVRNGAAAARVQAMHLPAKVPSGMVDFAANYGDDALRGVQGALSHLGMG